VRVALRRNYLTKLVLYVTQLPSRWVEEEQIVELHELFRVLAAKYQHFLVWRGDTTVRIARRVLICLDCNLLPG